MLCLSGHTLIRFLLNWPITPCTAEVQGWLYAPALYPHAWHGTSHPAGTRNIRMGVKEGWFLSRVWTHEKHLPSSLLSRPTSFIIPWVLAVSPFPWRIVGSAVLDEALCLKPGWTSCRTDAAEEQTRSVCGMKHATKKHTLQETADTKMVLLRVILLQDMVAVIAVVVDTGRHSGHTWLLHEGADPLGKSKHSPQGVVHPRFLFWVHAEQQAFTSLHQQSRQTGQSTGKANQVTVNSGPP